MEKEPERLSLIGEPKPTGFKVVKGWKWEKLLLPLKAVPGTTARIRTHTNPSSCGSDIGRIRRRLDAVAPLEDWTFQSGQIMDNSGMYGVWATFNGMMTELERKRKDLARAKHGRATNRGKEAARLRRALQAGSIPDITHPRRGQG